MRASIAEGSTLGNRRHLNFFWTVLNSPIPRVRPRDRSRDRFWPRSVSGWYLDGGQGLPRPHAYDDPVAQSGRRDESEICPASGCPARPRGDPAGAGSSRSKRLNCA